MFQLETSAGIEIKSDLRSRILSYFSDVQYNNVFINVTFVYSANSFHSVIY